MSMCPLSRMHDDTALCNRPDVLKGTRKRSLKVRYYHRIVHYGGTGEVGVILTPDGQQHYVRVKGYGPMGSLETDTEMWYPSVTLDRNSLGENL